MVLNLSHHVQADSGVHEEAIINHHGGIFLHLFGVVLSRWEELDHVGAGDVERHSEPTLENPGTVDKCACCVSSGKCLRIQCRIAAVEPLKTAVASCKVSQNSCVFTPPVVGLVTGR